MPLYKSDASKPFSNALFQAPTAAYRGTPFWSWNCQLHIPQLLRQIEQFKTMGMGGFHMHPRTGLATDYLGEDYFKAIVACTDKAEKEHMLAWVYDEDRWPSGFAGGLVTSNERYRARHLLITPTPYGPGATGLVRDSVAAGSRNENGRLLACYEVRLENGCLAHSQRIDPDAPPSEGCRKWWAYLETALPHAWFNNQTYVDTLNPRAIQAFVEITHERYRKHVGQHFGKTVPAIFTDEPQFTRKQHLHAPEDVRDICLPFTDDLFDTFAQAYGERLEPNLLELIWNLPGNQPSLARYRYHDHVAERFSAAFADTIGDWCEKYGVALTGHMMEEQSLHSQSSSLGEAMRSYRAFHLPGIDMLCDAHEFTTAKQAQSAVHQYGREGMLSELYGVTNWDFDFLGHFAQGNWQAALGVTVRVHHLHWVSMAGEAKRDYPAAIGYQSPWWQEYSYVEDYFSRLNVLLTRGTPVVRVGVVHPIESYWLVWGPTTQTHAERSEREQQFTSVTDWLLKGLIDFNFICESLLPTQSPVTQSKQLPVGQMKYDAVVVPALRTIRSTTLDRLEAFVDAGGTLVFAGAVPTLVDALPSDRAANLAARSQRIELTNIQLLAVLTPFREIESRDNLLYQMRQDGDERHLFVCDTRRSQAVDGATTFDAVNRFTRPATRLRLRGEWQVTRRDALSGTCEPYAALYDAGDTVVEADLPAASSIMLTLSPGRRTEGSKPDLRAWKEVGRVSDPVKVTLSEPNVLMLDQAEWRIDPAAAWEPREEMLRLDNLVRRKLGMIDRTGQICQPWADKTPSPVLAQVELRFNVQCDVPIKAPKLAAELPDGSAIWVDGALVGAKADGWWTDESILTFALPDLSAGSHEIRLRIPFKRWPGLEWCYLLGDFGVQVAGRHTRIVAPVRELAFGDWTRQGLPFYGGNVTYHCTLESSGAETAIDVPHFKAPLVIAHLDGVKQTPIALPPFRCEFGKVSAGVHKLDLTAFGSRINCFGPLHQRDPNARWFGPAAWRTSGNAWAYEYQIKPSGILQAPVVREPVG